MERMILKPEQETKKLWKLIWGIVFALGLLPGLVPAVLVPFPESLILWGYAALWTIILLLILAWIEPFYRSIEYVIDEDAVGGKRGVFWRRRTTVPYEKITNVDISQGPLERTFNIGKVHLQTAGAGGQQGAVAELKLVGIRDTEGVKETVMARVKAARPSGPQAAPAASAAPGEGEGQVLAQILEQLRAIRQALEGQER